MDRRSIAGGFGRRTFVLCAVLGCTVASTVAGGCDREATDRARGVAQNAVTVKKYTPPPPGDASSPVQPARQESAVSAESPRLIRVGEIVSRVDDLDAAMEAVDAIAADQGGFLSNTQLQRNPDGASRATLTLRVPSERFEEAMNRLAEVGRVESASTSTQDVTKEYFDLEVRLTVERETERRLREILRNRTGDLADVLKVEQELGRVVGQIERLEGERRYYERRIAMSTVTLKLHEPGAEPEAPGALAPVAHAFDDSVRVLGYSFGALVYIVVFLAPWLLAAALVWWIVAAIRGRRRATPDPGEVL